MKLKKEEYLGAIYSNKYNTHFKIIEYRSYKDLDVLDIEHDIVLKNINMKDLKLGYVISPLDKSVFDIGYLGIGNYIRGNHNKCYRSWYNMMLRCFSQEYKTKYPTYECADVCDEWLNYQNFAHWFDINYYEIDNERMELDKDILHKNNKLYSPSNCCFVPRRINSLLINNKNVRGKYLLGVDLHNNIYRARCQTLSGNKFLGNYNTEIDAFYAYKSFKEDYIKLIADEYKDKIPIGLYKALYKYTIDMED